ncbi:MAG: DUF3179 domain-containing protein [Acidimicrobiales bacterium]|nr:DUF3179 domain-containing protein [Acidimicrobiales bacterium]
MSRRIAILIIGLGVLAAACVNDDPTFTASPSTTAASGSPRSTTTTAPLRSFEVELIEPSPRENGPEALIPSEIPDIPTEVRFSDPGFGPTQIQSGDLKRGGPAPDGIPSIDEPRFHLIEDVDWLTDNEPVFVFELGGEARAYPLQIMMYHEIVNDTIAGVPVAVSYCPLCNSAFAHDRRHEGRVLEFGVSGALYNSSLVMFDRQTFSLWSHFTGQGLVGVFGGDQLTSYPVTLASWAEFRAAHPDGIVLSRDTGFDKDYGRNLYPGYDDVNTPPFFFDEGAVDGRYAAKTRIVGLALPAGAQAVTNQRLEADRVVPLVDGERPLVVWWQPGTRSALDASTIADGRDVGTTGAFEATLDGRVLTFRAVDGGFEDAETGSRWNVLGDAVAGPLAGRQLTRITHVDTFWFAWAAFKPETAVTG